MSDAILSVEDLTIRFGAVTAVDGVSLGVASAASMLRFQTTRISGETQTDVFFYGHPMLGAVESSFGLMFGIALVATVATLIRRRLAPDA